MEAGRELDALVAEKVMGLHEFAAYAGNHKASLGWGNPEADMTRGELHSLPHYSTDITAAWKVVEKIKSTLPKDGPNGSFSMIFEDGIWFVGYYEHENGWLNYFSSESAPHAICLAALNAVETK